jgi:hopanoid biosynthesis associated RND transporter like protein HpnN
MLLCSRIAHRYPWTVLLSSLALFAVSLLAAAALLEFQTDREDLISSRDELHEIQQRYLDEFPAADDVVVMVKGGDAARREGFVDTLAGLLLEHPQHFQAVFPRVELPFLKSRALLFLSEKELADLVAALEEAHPFLLSLSSPEGLASLLSDFEGNVSGSGQEKLVSMLPFLGDIFHELRRAVETRGRADYHSPWGGLLFGDSPELAERTQGGMQNTDFYHTTANGTVHLLLLRFVKRDAETIALLRETVEKAQLAYPGLDVGTTGEPLLEHDEMVSSESDSHQSGVLSLILVAILFAFTFRQFGRPFAIIGSFVLGAGWTIGFTTVVIGHLNLLTVSFFTILVGSGMDFGIHILLRYEEEFAKGQTTESAMDEALVGTGTDIAVSAFATAAAFWAVGLTDFKGVSELGVIAGFGILLCLVATVLPLPALMLLLDRRRKPAQPRAVVLGTRILAGKIEAAILRRAPWTLLFGAALLLAALPRIASVGFDYNLLRLQDPHLESVQTELRLIEDGGKTVLFSVALANDIEHARVLKARFEALPAVSHVDTVSDLFPEVTPAKLASLRRLRELVADVHIPDPNDVASGAVGSKELQRLGDGFAELERFFRAQRQGLLRHRSERVRASTRKFEGEMELLFSELSALGPGPIEDGLTNFQYNFFQDLDSMVEFLRIQDPDPQMSLSDLPQNLALRSIGRTGKLVLRIYPKENIWERDSLDRFVTQVRATDPTAIGAPVMIWHHTSMLKGAFEEAGLYAMVAVSVILYFYFRSLVWTLLSMIPLVLGVLFMLAMMASYGISFNLANFMGLPLLLGIGMDYGIHVLHRAKEERRVNMFDHSTGPATTLSALTTVAGFGTLALGGHQGVASLGFLLATGVVGILLSALLILPAILSIWNPFREQAEARPAPAVEPEQRKQDLSA